MHLCENSISQADCCFGEGEKGVSAWLEGTALLPSGPLQRHRISVKLSFLVTLPALSANDRQGTSGPFFPALRQRRWKAGRAAERHRIVPSCRNVPHERPRSSILITAR